MSLIELIPLNKGNHIILDSTTTITIGRTPHTGCLDNRISRNHVQLFIKFDGTLWIKPIHHNPTFYKTKTNQIVTLTKDKAYQLYDADQFGLLPDEYFYQVSIKPKNIKLEKFSERNQIIDSSTISKPPIKVNESLTIDNIDEEKEVTQSALSANSNTTGALPTPIHDREQRNDKANTIRSVKEEAHSEARKMKHNDHDSASSSSATFKTVHTTITNNIDLRTNSVTASIAAGSTKRKRCLFGESCYRTNVTHRQHASHPGDPDWDDNEENHKNKLKPECPYGDECYRKNPDHLTEYHHSKRRSIVTKDKKRTEKRKTSEIDDDDDGLPDEYDYNDSFIDDKDFDDSSSVSNEEESRESDSDTEWEPIKHSKRLSDIDDDSSDESDFDLTKKEADEFTKSSTTIKHGSSIKKCRLENDD